MEGKVGMTPKGQRMPDTLEEWRYLALLFGDKITDQRKVIGQLRHKINTLEQKLGKKNAKNRR